MFEFFPMRRRGSPKLLSAAVVTLWLTAGGSAGATRPELRVKRLDCGSAGGRLPHGHPSLNGAASDFDPIRDLGWAVLVDDDVELDGT